MCFFITCQRLFSTLVLNCIASGRHKEVPGDDTCGDHSRVLIKGESQSALKNIAWVPIIQKKKFYFAIVMVF